MNFLSSKNFRLSPFFASLAVAAFVSFGFSTTAKAQESFPADNGLSSYHSSPNYRESESSVFRVMGYALHPIGWVLREGIFRPVSFLISSNELSRSVFGYRDPYDFRAPECFSADDSVPDCRSVPPFNYDATDGGPGNFGTLDQGSVVMTDTGALVSADRSVYFPDVLFDFNKRSLTVEGRGRAKQITGLLQKDAGLKVVLQGHTDYIGSDAYNEKLGMDRAEALRAELVANGIPSDRLSTVSFGKSQPLYAEKEDWARALNRRVEVQPDNQ